MNGVIIALAVVAIALIIVVAAYRLTRNENQVPPRRREFNRLRDKFSSADATLDEIRDTLVTRMDTLDVVGQQLARDVNDLIRAHRNKITEIDR